MDKWHQWSMLCVSKQILLKHVYVDKVMAESDKFSWGIDVIPWRFWISK